MNNSRNIERNCCHIGRTISSDIDDYKRSLSEKYLCADATGVNLSKAEQHNGLTLPTKFLVILDQI